jgi:adenylate cyclase
MGREIERKFLVRGRDWREGAQVVRCRQGYLVSEIGRTIRVRLQGDRAFLTIKGKAEGLARLEYEYAIPSEDAHEILDQFVSGRIVEKNRYSVMHAGTKWEVDEFLGENTGLIVAEVELKSEDQAVELPGWVGAEVTHDPRYLNVMLAKQSYLTWGSAPQPADPVSREPEAQQTDSPIANTDPTAF